MASYLYVDDDRASRDVMRLLLGDVMGIKHYAILEPSGTIMDEIVALTPKPTIILLDIHMRPLNGFDLLKLMKSYPACRNCTIIALTASVMNEEVQQLKDAGFDGAISKPLDALTFPGLLERISQGETIWHVA